MSDLPKNETPALRAVPEPEQAAPQRQPESLGAFPQLRMRRNRRANWVRRMVAENRVETDDLIWPIFVHDGDGRLPVASMPGIDRLGLDCLVDAVGSGSDLGLSAVAIFPYTDDALKTSDCREAINPDNLVCRAVRRIKQAFPDIGLICDVALDPYNADGHDGLVRDGEILNDETIELLCQQALAQAQAGCDVVAPSDMMDGRIGALREALDVKGFANVNIIAYAAKYASCFYGPFRDAVGSGSNLTGDKKTYQLDPANSDEALREVALDLQEGADMVMIKPGMPYLDIIRRIKDRFGVPTAAYQVSGEYAMIKAAAQNGWLDNDKAIMESLLSFKRAGADAVLTYAAPEIATLLKQR
ncbi:porphobilinogen synthase [Pelagibius litoralis]|uniref:Delta-aminolevulinic acid dehydratase n=1 Tax=Pelagibius litoralis TaxID=374515 RepID=A0A967EUH9_9PROT|nr:porphobilinogen synthase [Pelagibius litoralis]NIA67022.1 porphobilinogen synthase [Pelagibius litoralis]